MSLTSIRNQWYAFRNAIEASPDVIIPLDSEILRFVTITGAKADHTSPAEYCR